MTLCVQPKPCFDFHRPLGSVVRLRSFHLIGDIVGARSRIMDSVSLKTNLSAPYTFYAHKILKTPHYPSPMSHAHEGKILSRQHVSKQFLKEISFYVNLWESSRHP